MSSYPQLQLYIDGRWKSASGQPVINPADETTLGTVPHATVGDLDDALEAAEKALRIWRNTAPAERCRIILKAAQIIRDRVDDMAVAMTLEQGNLWIKRGWRSSAAARSSNGMRTRGAASMAVSFRARRGCATRCCVSP